MKNKVCCRCKKKKPVSEFYKDRKKKDKLSIWCKECDKEYGKKWYQNNKEQLLKKQKKYYKNNREKMLKYFKENYDSEKGKRWRRNNPYRYWASATLNAHKARGYIVQIDTDELEKIAEQTKYCPICNVKLNWSTGKGKVNFNSPSLDRIKNEKNLTLDNTWIICYKCNIIKSDLTMKEFIDYCTMVSNKFTVKIKKVKE